MTLPFEYPRAAHITPAFTSLEHQPDIDHARVVVLPVPLTSGVSRAGVDAGAEAVLSASASVEPWDEETLTDICTVGILTLPALRPSARLDASLATLRTVAGAIVARERFPLFLGGDHVITAPIVSAVAQQFSGLSVLHIGAQAELRDPRTTTPFHPATAMRRTIEFARATQVGIRSLSTEEAGAVPNLPTELFFDHNMRDEANWIDRIIDSLGETVYLTIDVNGLDPSLMPAACAPEPGGLSWYELLAVLRRVIEARRVVGADLVGLSPINGWRAPNVVAARLLAKVIAYRFGAIGR